MPEQLVQTEKWIKIKSFEANIPCELDRAKSYDIACRVEIIDVQTPRTEEAVFKVLYIAQNSGQFILQNQEGKKVKIFTGKSEAQKTRLAMLDYYITKNNSDDGFDAWYINLHKTIRKNISKIEKFY